MQKIVVALAGQPNVGKSSLINAISNAKLKVGNFPGVTVEKKEIVYKLCDEVSCADYEVHIIDLPGAYSLDNYTIDEKVTKSFLQNDAYDIIVNVIDSTNLQRNLLFTAQLLEMGKKIIVVLNMIDEAKKEGIQIDEKQLEKIVGVPCIKVSSVTKEGIDTLKESIVSTFNTPYKMPRIVYSNPIEEEIDNIVNFFEEKGYHDVFFPNRLIAIKLLSEDEEIYKRFHDEPIWIELLPIVREGLGHIYTHANTKNLKNIFNSEHFAFAKGAKMEVMAKQGMKAKNLTQKIDNLLIGRFTGLPIFLFLMWVLFKTTFELGNIPMEYIDSFFTWLGEFVKANITSVQIGSLIGDGIIAGVGAVVMFLPNIIILFVGIALLETTGYMSRVAFLLDWVFHKFGMHGKSFIPLVTGFGCSVPAYMAARTLKNEKDRLITLFVIGFMSCGARLPVYVLFIGAFFAQKDAGTALFIIYLSGAILGLLGARVLKTFVFKGDEEPFVMEMPKYRLPSFKLIWHTVYYQAKSYLKKAGTFILLASMIIWFASSYPKSDVKFESVATQKQYELENSYLGMIGKASEPFFAPLGFDWKMSIALESGLAAKEVVVSTLGVLYNMGDGVDEHNSGLVEQIKKNIPFASALSFIVFVMIYLPCLAASMVFAKEAGGWKYLGYLFLFTTGTAWILSFIVYNIVHLMGA